MYECVHASSSGLVRFACLLVCGILVGTVCSIGACGSRKTAVTATAEVGVATGQVGPQSLTHLP